MFVNIFVQITSFDLCYNLVHGLTDSLSEWFARIADKNWPKDTKNHAEMILLDLCLISLPNFLF